MWWIKLRAIVFLINQRLKITLYNMHFINAKELHYNLIENQALTTIAIPYT